ncbi:unnamed protein product [Amoebophrya sp. A25]|nr:unnamed protein product [Amoebophrya sp. A25]|eukprot:GSA25T00004632001.1
MIHSSNIFTLLDLGNPISWRSTKPASFFATRKVSCALHRVWCGAARSCRGLTHGSVS